MASWIFISLQISLLVALSNCIQFHESIEEYQPHGDDLKGLELIAEHGAEAGGSSSETTHHGEGHHHATSYQSFYLESKDPVPVVIKKEHLHHSIPEHLEISHEEAPKLSIGLEEESQLQFHHGGEER